MSYLRYLAAILITVKFLYKSHYKYTDFIEDNYIMSLVLLSTKCSLLTFF